MELAADYTDYTDSIRLIRVIRGYLSSSLPFEEVAPIDIERFAIPEHGDDESQADGRFSRGHNQHEEHKNLTVDLTIAAGERDEGQVHRVEHDFHREEQGNDVPLDEEAQHSQKEQPGAEKEIPVQGNHRSFFAKTTAPMSAIRMSSDVSSKG